MTEGETKRGRDRMQEVGRQERFLKSKQAEGVFRCCITGGGGEGDGKGGRGLGGGGGSVGRTLVYQKDEKEELRK